MANHLESRALDVPRWLADPLIVTHDFVVSHMAPQFCAWKEAVSMGQKSQSRVRLLECRELFSVIPNFQGSLSVRHDDLSKTSL